MTTYTTLNELYDALAAAEDPVRNATGDLERLQQR